GRVIRLMGDGSLVEFASAVDALAAAIDFQQAMIEANRGQPDDKAITFRIGLHLGDIIVEGDDIYGDAVNVAAPLEAEAPPGGGRHRSAQGLSACSRGTCPQEYRATHPRLSRGMEC